MNISSIMSWVQKALEFFVQNFLKAKFPAFSKVFDRMDDILTITQEVVGVAEGSGADGPAKFAQASQDLVAKLKADGLDLSPDVATMIVNAMVAGLNRFFHLSKSP